MCEQCLFQREVKQEMKEEIKELRERIADLDNAIKRRGCKLKPERAEYYAERYAMSELAKKARKQRLDRIITRRYETA